MFNPWFIFVLTVLHTALEASLVTNCGSDEFPCNDGSCIQKTEWCDSAENCADDSDELYCIHGTAFRPHPNRCDQNAFFVCKDGPCIPISGKCDGLTSCEDKSDEEDCATITQTTFWNETSTLTLEVGTHAPEEKSRKHQRDIYHHSKKPVASQNKSQELLKHSDIHALSNKNHSVRNMSLDENNNATSNLKVPNGTRVKEDLKYIDIRGQVYENSAVSKTTNSNHDILNHAVRENSTHLNALHHKEDLEVEFVQLNANNFRKERYRAEEMLLKTRDENYGWGDETARAITALYMSENDFGKKIFSDKLLMSKQLKLKLFIALIRNETKPIALEELSLFINALSASCEDPRNFYGEDLVNVLRLRTNNIEASSVISPFVFLTLCLNNVTTDMDVEKIRDFVHNEHHTREFGIDAVVSLASTCISRSLKSSSYQIGKQMAAKLLHKVASEGLPESIYDLALVTQALNEAGINPDRWNRSEAIKRILEFQMPNGSFGDILSTYYAMPLLAGKSLVSLGVNCIRKDEGLVPVEVLKNSKVEKMHVSYSLYFGNPPEMTHTLAIKVGQFSSLFDVMRIAETVNPSYKFKYALSGGKPRVYSIGGIVDDAEKGLYWYLYLKHDQMSNGLERFDGDIRNLTLKTGQNFVFWLKSAL